MSNVTQATPLPGKKLHDGMIKSRSTKAGDIVIAVICFILMLVCLLVTAACAEAGTLPTINSLLQSNAGKKAEVRDNLDMYGRYQRGRRLSEQSE